VGGEGGRMVGVDGGEGRGWEGEWREYFRGTGNGAFEGFVAGGVALGGGGFGVTAHVEGRWLGISGLFGRFADG